MSLILRTDARVADELSDALLAHGVQSVSVEDANAGTDDEAPLYGEPGMPVTCTAADAAGPTPRPTSRIRPSHADFTKNDGFSEC